MRLIATMVLLGCLAMAQTTTPAPKAEEKKSGCCNMKSDKSAKDAKDKKADGGCCGDMSSKEGSMCARKEMKDDKPAEKKK